MTDLALPEPDNLAITLPRTLTSLIAGSRSIDDLVLGTLEALCGALGWDFGAAFLLGPDGVLANRITWHLSDPLLAEFETVTKASRFSSESGLPGRVLAAGKPAWIEDIALDNNFRRAPFAIKAGLQSAVAFPITASERVLGTLEIFSRARIAEDQALIQVVERLGAEIGQFVRLQETEALLARSEAIRHDLIESAIDAIISMDSLGVVQAWNSEATRLFGWQAGEALGQRLSQLIIPERYRDAHEKGLKRFMVTGEGPVIGARIEIEACRKDGSELPVELAVSALRLEREVSFTASVRDISERKAQERRRDDFLAFASHELRNPLASVFGSAQMLARFARNGQLDDPSSRELIELLATESDRMTKIVDVFLDLAQIQSDRMDLKLSNVDLRGLAENEVSLAQRRNPEAVIQLSAAMPRLLVWTDETRLQQVLSNLIENESSTQYTCRQ